MRGASVRGKRMIRPWVWRESLEHDLETTAASEAGLVEAGVMVSEAATTTARFIPMARCGRRAQQRGGEDANLGGGLSTP